MMDQDKYLKEIEYLHEKIKDLNGVLWEGRLSHIKLEEWLGNFESEDEKDAALYLLSKFVFFNEKSIRMLLVALYRDLYKYPIIETIRKNNGHTLDEAFINTEFKKVRNTTLFACVGDTSESSSHLQYPFRQENKISKSLFVDYERHGSMKTARPLTHCIFIDDFCGTGEQVITNMEVKDKISYLRANYPSIKIFYYTLIATMKGMERVFKTGIFDEVDSVYELDESFECFSPIARIFDDECLFDKNKIEKMCRKYGIKLMEHFITEVQRATLTSSDLNKVAGFHSLGFCNCQLLVGMNHNVPDNTLPIIWYDENHALWKPIFKRANKIY